MTEGRIIRSLSGFYDVELPGGEILRCRARGKFRKDSLIPLVGDFVTVRDGTVLDSVIRRKNSFIRPACANLDALVFVASCAKPVTDPFLIDRVSVIAKANDCELMVVINKTDLADAGPLGEICRKAGFETFSTCAATGEGIAELKKALHGKISAFTGNSGVGKSSILNLLIPGTDAATDEISEKLGRGKHTTRHVELYRIDEHSAIADTPGYASFEIAMMESITRPELAGFFPDFAPYGHSCRFPDCHHISEPGCEVKAAVERNELAPSRYESYLRLYDNLGNLKAWD